jgi:hypothetical protein
MWGLWHSPLLACLLADIFDTPAVVQEHATMNVLFTQHHAVAHKHATMNRHRD